MKRFTRSAITHGSETPSGQTISTETLNKMIAQLEITDTQEIKVDDLKLAKVFAEQIFKLPNSVSQTTEMPGPTGELNLLSETGRGIVLCLGPDAESAKLQAATALMQGNSVIIIAQGIAELLKQCALEELPVQGMVGQLSADVIIKAQGFAAICCNAQPEALTMIRQALAARDGALLPLITELDQPERFVMERHLCIDTTAAGGNASLIATAG